MIYLTSLFLIFLIGVNFLERDTVIKAILACVLLLLVTLITQLTTDGININNNTPVIVPSVVNTESEGAKMDDEENEAIIKQDEALTNKSN